MKILIVGAGVAGLAIGWRLAQAGADIEVLERGRAGQGATWAAAGMLAPGAEIGAEPGPLAQFARESRNAWPSFAAELESASGCDIGFRQDGSLVVADNEDRAGAIKEHAAKLKSLGQDVSWLRPQEMLAREPLLSSDLHGALYVADDAHVDNRALPEALRIALERTHARLREGCEVRSLIVDNNRLRGVVTQDGAIESDMVILASGAWLTLVGGLSADILPRVTPVKGQMIAFEPPLATVLPKALLWSDEVYIVARRGRLFAGATVEDAGFNTSVTREARDTLVRATARLIPAVSQWRLAEIWAGLRPRASDGSPVLGQTAIEGLYVASGQFRNGILFAPLVAEIMRGIVLGERKSAGASFDPKRFAGP